MVRNLNLDDNLKNHEDILENLKNQNNVIPSDSEELTS